MEVQSETRREKLENPTVSVFPDRVNFLFSSSSVIFRKRVSVDASTSAVSGL